LTVVEPRTGTHHPATTDEEESTTMTNASVIALILVGSLLVLMGIRVVPDAPDSTNVVAAGSLALIALGEVALIAAGVLQVVGMKRA
jgi:hypothetical protein